MQFKNFSFFYLILVLLFNCSSLNSVKSTFEYKTLFTDPIEISYNFKKLNHNKILFIKFFKDDISLHKNYSILFINGKPSSRLLRLFLKEFRIKYNLEDHDFILYSENTANELSYEILLENKELFKAAFFKEGRLDLSNACKLNEYPIFFAVKERKRQEEINLLEFAERNSFCNKKAKISYKFKEDKLTEWILSLDDSFQEHKYIQDKNIRLLIFGDSLSITYSWGFEPIARGYGIEFENYGKVSSGLLYKSNNWEIELSRILNHKYYDYAIMLLGANDDGAIIVDNTKIPFYTNDWKYEYSKRLRNIIIQLDSKKIKTFFSLLPVIRNSSKNKNYIFINSVIKDIADKHSIPIIDLYTLFSNEKNLYSDRIEFREQKQFMRAEDGIHFTRKGGELMTLKVLEKLYSEYLYLPVKRNKFLFW